MDTEKIRIWASEIIDRVKRGQPHEDSRVELKAAWPDDFNKTARQIAGHANAAGGEPVLWLIGVDEKNGVVGVLHNELSNWRARLATEFDDLVPAMQDLNLTIEGKTAVALLFETDQAPYVVRNEKFDKPERGRVQFEVPWREATSTRSARRRDLLKLFSSKQSKAELRRKFEEFFRKLHFEWDGQQRIDPFDRKRGLEILEDAHARLLDLVVQIPNDADVGMTEGLSQAVCEIQHFLRETKACNAFADELPRDFWKRGHDLLCAVQNQIGRILS